MVAIRKWSVASALVAGVWLLLAGVKAQQPAPPPGNYVAGEVLVTFSASVNANQRDNMIIDQTIAFTDVSMLFDCPIPDCSIVDDLLPEHRERIDAGRSS